MSGKERARVAGLFLALLLLGAGAWYHWVYEEPPLQRLQHLVAGSRVVEPRLGDLPFAACELRERNVGLEAACLPLDADRRSGAGRIVRGAGRGFSIEHLRGAALATLLGSSRPADFDEAARTLERLAVVSGSASIFADLAGAHLLRAGVRSDVLAYTQAVTAARRGTEIDPRCAPCWFNLALAYERLLMRRSAIAAWQAVLDLDGSDGWRQEAHAHLDHLCEAGDIDARREQGMADVRRGDGEALGRVIRQHPQLVRDVARLELYPDWARSRLAGDGEESARKASFLVRLGELSREAGEPFFAAAAAGLGVAAADTLAAALLELDQARRDFEAKNPAACGRLATIEDELRRLDSPFALEALRLQASCAYYAADPHRLDELAGSLIEEASARGFPSFEGKGWWLRGTAFFDAGRPGDAARAYQRADLLFARSRETGNQASIAGQLASLAAEVGDFDRSARERFRAIEASLLALNPRWPVLWHTAAIETLDLDPQLALAQSLESADVDLGAADPAAVFDALLLRGRIRRHLRNERGAEADLRRCTALTAHFPAAVRRRFESLGLFLEAEVGLATGEPARARSAAARALALSRQEGNLLLVPELFSLQAEAEERLGDGAGALASLKEALAILAGRAVAAGNVEERVRLFERAEKLMERTITLELETSGMPDAFETLERYRSGFLLERIHGAPAALSDLERGLSENETLLVFHPRNAETLVWKIEAWGTRGFRLPIGDKELEKETLRLLAHLRSPASEFLTLAGESYDRLIAPLGLSEGRRIAIVAPAVLSRLPFAALYHRRQRRFLIEEASLSFAPSASVRRALQARTGGEIQPGALVIGDPELPPGTGLESLPLAGLEAETVAAEWPRSLVLKGRVATAGALLREAPGRRILHFAGHAQANPERFLSGKLLLAADEAHPNGELSASALFDQDFSSIELITLSACSSGTGFLSAAEGRLDFAVPFLAAGASNVIATLWPIKDSQAQVDFFRIFYRELQIGRDPQLALQKAQIALIHHRATTHRSPIHWAAFQLIGTGEFREGGQQ